MSGGGVVVVIILNPLAVRGFGGDIIFEPLPPLLSSESSGRGFRGVQCPLHGQRIAFKVHL